MGQNQDTNEVIKYLDIEFLLSAYGHIRVLMEDAGLGIYKGVILFVPDPGQVETIISDFEQCGAVRGQIRGQKLPSAFNYDTVIAHCQAHYRQESVLEFLSSSQYFPMLIVSGKIPDWLQNYPNIILLEQYDDDDFNVGIAKKRAKFLQKFIQFSHQHTEQLEKFLHNIKKQAWFIGISDRRRKYQTLFCMGKVYDFYLHVDGAGQNLPFDFHKFLDTIICEAFDFENFEMNMGNKFYNALVQHLDVDKDILLGPLNRIEGALIQAVEEEQAILFDDDFYYMPESMFRKITKRLNFEISSRSLKSILLQEHVLVCNNTRRNYTVKKLLTNVNDETIRVHLLKFRREQLEAGEQLSLIERRKPYVHRTM